MYSAVQWVNIRHMRAHPARTADGMTTFLRRPRSSKTIWFQLPLSMHLGLFAFFLCVLTNEWSWSSDAGNGSHSNVDINLVVSDREISHIHNSDALYLLPAIIIINAAARQRYFFFVSHWCCLLPTAETRWMEFRTARHDETRVNWYGVVTRERKTRRKNKQECFCSD